MSIGSLIVILIRLLIPLTILRWRFIGYVLSLIVDATDVVLITFLNLGEFPNYHQFDKILDLYFLSIACYVSLSWKNSLAKRTSIFLFGYRIIGVVLFELLQVRWVLFVFPNLFGFYYLFYSGYQFFFKKDPIKTKKRLFIVLFILLCFKMPQEYVLHVAQAQPWKWIRVNVLQMER